MAGERVENQGTGEASSGGAADPAAERVGQVVDKYTVVRLLGRGGMGAVYEARHARLARRFGIKFLLPELANNREVLRRFENEAKAAGGLEHPNLVAVTDFGRASDGAPYLVMEYLDGEDCSKLLRRLGSLPVARAAGIVLQACRGLAVAHKAEIVHRDLKPENLFLTDAGDGTDLIKVLDFGIAKLRPSEASVVTGTGATFGTAFYMSPEQARGAGDVDPRTDVWSLGIVLYELLTGKKPFEGEQFLQVIHQILSVDPLPVTALRPGVPAALAALIARAMDKDLGRRLPSVGALAEGLRPFATRASAPEVAMSPAEAVAATRPTPETALGDVGAAPSGVAQPNKVAPAPRRRAPLIVGGATLAVIAAVVVWIAWRMSPPARPAPAGAPPAATAPVAPAATTREETPVPAVPAPAALPAPPAPSAIAPAPPPSPASPSVAPAATAARRVRTRSEQSGHDSRPGSTPAPTASPPKAAEAPVPPPPPKPAPARDEGRGRRLDIEKANPYDNP